MKKIVIVNVIILFTLINHVSSIMIMPPKNLVSNEEENLIDQRKIKNEKIAPAEFNTYYPQNSHVFFQYIIKKIIIIIVSI